MLIRHLDEEGPAAASFASSRQFNAEIDPITGEPFGGRNPLLKEVALKLLQEQVLGQVPMGSTASKHLTSPTRGSGWRRGRGGRRGRGALGARLPESGPSPCNLPTEATMLRPPVHTMLCLVIAPCLAGCFKEGPEARVVRMEGLVPPPSVFGAECQLVGHSSDDLAIEIASGAYDPATDATGGSIDHLKAQYFNPKFTMEVSRRATRDEIEPLYTRGKERSAAYGPVSTLERDDCDAYTFVLTRDESCCLLFGNIAILFDGYDRKRRDEILDGLLYHYKSVTQ